MKLLDKLTKYFLGQERNVDWSRIVALDTNRALIDLLPRKYQQANQRIKDLENIVAIYEERRKRDDGVHLPITIVELFSGLW